MRGGNVKANKLGQAGFSMVEMLMAAFILAIGILGLTMLQTMSLRTARGGQNLRIAVQLAEQVMDQTELEGRLTYLNATDTTQTTPTALVGLTYINQNSVDQYFNLDPVTGQPVVTTTNLPHALFHMNMSQTYVTGTTLSEVTVKVMFTDSINPANQAIIRTAAVTRRILHG